MGNVPVPPACLPAKLPCHSTARQAEGKDDIKEIEIVRGRKGREGMGIECTYHTITNWIALPHNGWNRNGMDAGVTGMLYVCHAF